MLRILVNGARGKMGQQAVEAIQADPQLELVATADHHDHLLNIIRNSKPQVVVDFTTASAVWENTKIVVEANLHPVVGTTGFSTQQMQQLTDWCQQKKLGAIIAPNFSIGAILMMRFAKEAAQFFPHVEIIELHHDGKEDTPSGTAIKTAEMIASNKKVLPKKTYRETVPGAQGADHHGIPIHSVRLPGFVAHQEVIFGGTGETLHIRHDSIHRQCFMPGLLLACKKVVELDHLVYGLDQILFTP